MLVWAAGEVNAHEFIAPTLEELHTARVAGRDALDALLRRFSSRGDEWEEEVGCAAEPSHIARLDVDIVRRIKERVCRTKPELRAAFQQARAGTNVHVSLLASTRELEARPPVFLFCRPTPSARVRSASRLGHA